MNVGQCSFDPELFLFSYGIAVLASYTLLDLRDKLGHSRGWSRCLWLLFGATAMGIGVWSVHFIAMLSMFLPGKVGYDLVRVVMSVVAAMASTGGALHLIGRKKVTRLQWIGGSLLLAGGVAAVHYIAMSAMLLPISYNAGKVILSVFIAAAGSSAALALSIYFRKQKTSRGSWMELSSGLILGAAIAGTHYTGMWGTSYSGGELQEPIAGGLILKRHWLVYDIAFGTVVTLGLSMIGLMNARRAERQKYLLSEKERMFRSLYENNQDGILTFDLQQRMIGINSAAAEIFGLEESNNLDLTLNSLMKGSANESHYPYIAGRLTRESASYEMTFELDNGKTKNLHLMTVPLEVDGKLAGHFLVVRDITAEKRAEEQIRFLAFHDELTGLDNRRKFNQRLNEMIASHGRVGSRFAIMVMDMDRFKLINDSLGHMYGDLFLREMSRRIQAITEGRSVSLARIGGDEITVLYEQCDEAKAADLAGKFVHVIQQPFRLKESDFFVTASVGIAMYPEHGRDELELMKHADAAMYEVKNNGKNGYCFFGEELEDKLKEKGELEADLRQALQQQAFVLYYQPQMRVEDRRIVGVEALVRWRHSRKGIIGPGEFIPLAEELGLIVELGNWVLKEACRQMKEWHDNGGPPISVSVNLSYQQFHQSNLAQVVTEILAESGLAARYLELEITENIMMDPSVSMAIVQQLSGLGVRISLDGFGTGFSSLAYLKKYPIHKLKIDRSFVRGIVENPNDEAIVSTIIAMAQHLDMDVIAEGVETREQLEVLTEHNCKEIQGFYYSRPMSAEELESSFLVS